MSEEPSSYMAMIQACEAAITRIRAAIRAGQQNAPEVGEDYEFISQAVKRRFSQFAHRMHFLGSGVADEALEAMNDQLWDDILSLTYSSMETAFGAYLNHRPVRVLERMQRKYGSPDASLIPVRLDTQPYDDGATLHETIADPQAEAAFAAIGEHEAWDNAIARLPDVERHVINLRWAGYQNKEIAQRLGITPVAATRIYKRAVARLRQQPGLTEE